MTRYFFDNNFSYKIAEELRLTGDDVVHLKEVCSQKTRDVDWLKMAGEFGWVIFTLDTAIRRKPLERLALQEAHVTAVFVHNGFFDWGRLEEQRMWFKSRWQQIKTQLAQFPVRTSLSLTMDGKMKAYPETSATSS